MRHVLVNEAGRLALWLFDKIAELNDIGAAIECLKNLYFSVNLLCFHWFQYLDDGFLLIRATVAEIYLRILATTEFVMHFVVANVAPLDVHCSVE